MLDKNRVRRAVTHPHRVLALPRDSVVLGIAVS